MSIFSKFINVARKLRVALTPRSWLLTTRLSDGLVIQGSNRAGYGGRGIYIFREEIEPEFSMFTEFLPDDNGVMIDIGACTGIYGLRAARHFAPSGTVIVVEPVPEILAVLARNVGLNALTNVRCRNYCVGKATGVETFWMNGGTPNSYSLSVQEEGAGAMSVFVVSLDDLVDWEGLTRLDYLKIDAEGSETDILEGGGETIQKYRPIIQAEVSRAGLAKLELPGYITYSAPASPNVMLLPDGHPKQGVMESLRWQRL